MAGDRAEAEAWPTVSSRAGALPYMTVAGMAPVAFASSLVRLVGVPGRPCWVGSGSFRGGGAQANLSRASPLPAPCTIWVVFGVSLPFSPL